MSNHFEELRTARREGRPLHQANTQMSDRFHELRTARREGRPLHQPNTSRKRDDPTKELQPGSRYRRPTPHHIEQHRREGVVEPYPKGDSPLIDALRGRSRSSPPPRTRAPTPHPRASAPRMTKKTVHWADPLEQPTPQKIGAGRKRRDSETPGKDVKDTLKEDQSCTLRRYRASSIPRPKRSGSEPEVSKPSCSDRRPTPIFTIEVKLASQARQPPQRPLIPLIPQAMPAPLRISPIKTSARRTGHTIPSSVSAPEVQAKYLPGPSQSRSFSFEDQPEVITLSPDRLRPHQHNVPQTTNEKPSSSPPTHFSYLKEKPRRRGTIRPRPSDTPLASDTPPASAAAASSKQSLPSSTPTSSFHSAKNFWSDISDSRKNCDSSSSKSPSPIKPAQAQVDVTLDRDASGSPSKIPVPKIPIPSSAPSSSFHAAKDFWSGISSCGAIVDGAEPVKPVCGPSAVADRAEVCKTSKVAELARYTVNRPVVVAPSSTEKALIAGSKTGGSIGRDQFKSKIPVSSTLSYHVTKTQQSRYVPLRAVIGGGASRSSLKPPVDAGSGVTGSTTSSSYRTAQGHPSVGSDSDAPAPVSSPKTTSTALTTSILSNNDSAQTENTPSLQSHLWDDVMKLCISESSSCPKYCDCDDCTWSGQEGVDRCSTVAHVDDGKCKGR